MYGGNNTGLLFLKKMTALLTPINGGAILSIILITELVKGRIIQPKLPLLVVVGMPLITLKTNIEQEEKQIGSCRV